MLCADGQTRYSTRTSFGSLVAGFDNVMFASSTLMLPMLAHVLRRQLFDRLPGRLLESGGAALSDGSAAALG